MNSKILPQFMSVMSSQNPGLDPYALDLKTDSDEIYSLFKENPQSIASFLTRLWELQSYSTIMKILNDKRERLVDNTEVFHQVLEILVVGACTAKNESLTKEFIVFFMGLLPLVKQPFQIFLICKAVSSLVIINSRFPSKGLAIRYFKYVSSVFKRTGNWYNYLMSLSILDTLEKVQMLESEFIFLKRCAGLRKERVCKELFCGAKAADLDGMFIGKVFQSGEYTPNQNWKRLLDIKENNEEIAFDVDFCAFLRKAGVGFAVLDNGNVRVGEYEDVGHTTRIFQIAKLYEIEVVQPKIEKARSIPNLERIKLSKNEDGPQNATVPVEPTAVDIVEPASEFTDRFRIPHKRFKWYYSQVSRHFSDTSLEERNANRRKLFEEVNAKYESERQIFMERKDKMAELIRALEQKIKEHNAMEHQKLLEKQRLEQERELEERQKRLWKNRPRAEPAAPSVYTPPSRNFSHISPRPDNSESTDGSYVPPHLLNYNRDKTGGNSK